MVASRLRVVASSRGRMVMDGDGDYGAPDTTNRAAAEAASGVGAVTASSSPP